MKTKHLNTKSNHWAISSALACITCVMLASCTIGPKAKTNFIRIKKDTVNKEGKPVPAVAGMITDKRTIEVAVPDKDGNIHVGKVNLEGYDFITPEPEVVE
jgi:hypothetical protein